jgi:hypothetical protein
VLGQSRLDQAELRAQLHGILWNGRLGDPDRIGLEDLLAYTAIALASLWRNSPIEDLHGDGGPLSDGDMFRLNTRTTAHLRGILVESVAKLPFEVALTGPCLQLQQVPERWLSDTLGRCRTWLTRRDRRLLTGGTLGQVLGNHLDEYRAGINHGIAQMRQYEPLASTVGALLLPWSALWEELRLDLPELHWWGSPHWPAQVERFLIGLSDPDDIAWNGREPSPPDYLPQVDELRRLLLEEPWRLDARAADWIAAVGQVGHRHG